MSRYLARLKAANFANALLGSLPKLPKGAFDSNDSSPSSTFSEIEAANTSTDAVAADRLGPTPPLNECGALDLPTLEFDASAFDTWRAIHDDVERKLRPGGELADIKDVASKAADNVARMATLFHLYQYGATGKVGPNEVRGAGAIVTWHLLQARGFLNDVAAPRHVTNARRLDAWLVDRCRILRVQEVDRRDAQNRGPIRDGKELDAALTELAEADRARTLQRGNKRLIAVNPALLRGQP